MGRMRRRPRAAHAAPPVAACCLAPQQLIACGQAQPGPLPPPDPDQIIDRYLSGTETAFADGSLVELQQSVSEIAYQVDGEIITRLAAGGRHEERSFHRVGHARVITSGSGGTYLVIETSIRVDRDADVDSHGRNTVRFAPQTLLLQYTFLRLTADVARLLQACLATPQSEPIVGASPVIPTPRQLLSTSPLQARLRRARHPARRWSPLRQLRSSARVTSRRPRRCPAPATWRRSPSDGEGHGSAASPRPPPPGRGAVVPHRVAPQVGRANG